MADTTNDGTVEDLLGEIAALHDALDPVPPSLTDDIRFAMTVQSLHAEVAELVSTPALAVRADDAPARTDTITFSSGAVSLMVSVDSSNDDLTLDGWVTNGGALIEVHVGDEVRTAQADEYGRFVLDGVTRGRTWFVVRRSQADDDPPIVTPPVEL